MTAQRARVAVASGDGSAGNRGVTFWPYAAAVIAGVAVCVYLAVWGGRYGLDLRVYRDAVDYWRSGRNPYFGTFTRSRLAFTYPPFALPVLSPLAWAPFPVAQWLLWGASILATAASVLLVLRARGHAVTPRLCCVAVAWSCAGIIALEPARSGVDYGQIEFILMFFVVADLLLVPSSYRGILIGAAGALKLTPLIFIMVLIAGRDVRSVLRAGGSFLVFTAMSWLLWPELSHQYWLHDVFRPSRVGTIIYGGNQSWYAILHRPPFPATGLAFGWLLVCIVTLILSTFIAWHCVTAGQKVYAIILAALAGLLISPISWTHHWIWVLLIPPLVAGRRDPAMSQSVLMLLWGLVVLTIAAPYWWFSRGIPADVCDAILPLWTSVLLVVSSRSVARWPGREAPGPHSLA